MASGIVKYGGGFIGACLAIGVIGMIFATILPNHQAPAAPPSLSAQKTLPPEEKIARTPKVRPEQIVQFSKPNAGCITLDILNEAANHQAKGEKTKFKGLFDDGKCILLPPKVGFKILSIPEDHDDFAVIEITAADNKTGHEGIFAEWHY